MPAEPDEQPPVGWLCAYTPEEIIHAAGARPCRLGGPGTAEDVNRQVPSGYCGYVRRCLGGVDRTTGRPLAAAVIANCCQAAETLADAWSCANPNVPVCELDVPRLISDEACRYFRDRLQETHAALCARLGTAPDVHRLRAAIRLYNRSRVLLSSLISGGLGGSALYHLLCEGIDLPRSRFNARLETLLAAPRQERSGPGVVLSCGMVLDRGILDTVEAAGACVAYLDSCVGNRYACGLADGESPDPFLALAQRYLTRPPCARMRHSQARVDAILGVARRLAAQGVIAHALKFCVLQSFDAMMLREACRRAGIPFLFLEDDGRNGQVRSRIEAFVEML